MRTLPLMTAALAAAALIPATAAAEFELVDMQLDVSVTGTHTVTWNEQSRFYPDPDSGWTHGTGTQTVRFADAKPVRYTGRALRGRYPYGQLAPLELAYPDDDRLAVRVTRKGEWTENVDECDGEGCGDTGYHVFVPLQRCPAKAFEVEALLESEPPPEHGSASAKRRLAFNVTADGAFDDLWDLCAPFSRVQLAQVPPVVLDGGIGKVAGLRRGQSVTLTGQRTQGFATVGGVRDGRCPNLGAEGRQECAKTTIAVKVERVR